MLDIALCNKFIEKVNHYTEYNINIMDDNGIIIASHDPNRIGSFHYIAYQIIQSGMELLEVRDEKDFPGVLPGINMIILVNNERVGVVGVTGAPDKIKSVALMIKMSIETMLAYEMSKEAHFKRQSSKERFINYLLIDNLDIAKLKQSAAELGYRDDCVRICILCKLKDGEYAEEFIRRLKSSEMHTKQNISFILDDSHILIFMMFPAQNYASFLADYKAMIGCYLADVLHWLLVEDICCKFYIGSFQNNLANYKASYEHCKWLENNIVSNKKAEYFYDHTGDYFLDIIPSAQLYSAFNVFLSSLPAHLRDEYVTTFSALIKNNYNLKESSKDLYVHNNTLTYRYNKLKNLLNINPILSASDRDFCRTLYLFFISAAGKSQR